MSETDLDVQVNFVDGGDGDDHDPHYDPIISLPEVAVSTNEEDEIELIKLRAKLFRYDTSENPPEWKERGTGDVKLLQHKTKYTVRVVMRRDKTLKICANHFVTPTMELKPNCGSDRAWVWSVLADFADETAHTELLAIRFANADNAKKWKEMFEEAKTIVATKCELYTEVPDDLKGENLSESKEENSSESEEENNVGESLQNEVGESLQNLNLNDTHPAKKDSEKDKNLTEESIDK